MYAWSLCSIFVCAFISAVAGTGGGALYMPILTLSLKDPHLAVPLSKSTIFGVSLASVVLNLLWFPRKHKNQDKPQDNLILFPLAANFEPMTLAGATFGVILNIVMSSFQIVVFLVIVLSFTTFKTFHKGVSQWKSEQATRRTEQRFSIESPEEQIELTNVHYLSLKSTASYRGYENDKENREQIFRDMSTGNDSISSVASIPLLVAPQSQRSSAKTATDQDFRTMNIVSITVVLCSWLAGVIFLITSGGPAALLCGSKLQKALLSLELVIHFAVTVVVGVFAYKKSWWTKMSSTNNDHLWSSRTIAFMGPAAGFFSGVCAGCLGIGGGLIKGPVILHMGVTPLQTVATTSFMILFTSSTNTVSYIVSGRLIWTQSIVYMAVAFVASILGTLFIHGVTQKWQQRYSITTLFLASVILISMIAMVAVPVFEYSVNPAGVKSLSLDDVCRQFLD